MRQRRSSRTTLNRVGKFPVYVEDVGGKPFSKEHRVHALKPISFCGNCGEPVLRGCTFRGRKQDSRGRWRRYECIYTEPVYNASSNNRRIPKLHRCRDTLYSHARRIFEGE